MRMLIGEIVQERIAEGELLPREADLAERFDVSRGVARETIRGLEERGLVRVKHGRGASVTGPADWNSFDPEVLSALMTSPRGPQVLADYLECRRVLEVHAARLAAECADRQHVEELARAYARMEESANTARRNPAAEETYHEADIGFHRAVVNAAQNRVLGQMTEPLHRALTAVLRPLARPEYRFERGLPEHRHILETIEARDVDAAGEAMEEHLLTVERYVREYSRSDRWSHV
jgi:DNA-binding FadR family transcriptional regulator